MTEFISNLIGNDYVATSIMSMLPLIELKGGIMFARNFLGFFAALGLAYIGSTIVMFPLYFLIRPILNLLKKIKIFNSLALKLEDFFANRAQKSKLKNPNGSKSEKFIKQLSVFIFVAIPLPVTGVWTGTIIAVFLGLKLKDTILPIALGNLVAGILISLLAELCIAVWSLAVLDYILYGLLGLALIMLVITIIKISKSKGKKEN